MTPTTARMMGMGVLVCTLTAGTSSAWADELYSFQRSEPGVFSNLEITLGTGLLDRGTTGTGDGVLLGQEYDSAGGLYGALDLRLFFDEDSRYFRHGILARLVGTSGSAGFSSQYGMRVAYIDAAYAFRMNCPCISSEDRQWYVTAMIGMSGAYADAGTGRGDGNVDNERQNAATQLDHTALGAMMAVDFSAHFGPAIVGVDVGLRYLGGIDSQVSRTFAVHAGLRAGVNINL